MIRHEIPLAEALAFCARQHQVGTTPPSSGLVFVAPSAEELREPVDVGRVRIAVADLLAQLLNLSDAHTELLVGLAEAQTTGFSDELVLAAPYASSYPSSLGFPVAMSVRRASGGSFAPICALYSAATLATASGSPLMCKAGRLHLWQREKPISVMPGTSSSFFAH